MTRILAPRHLQPVVSASTITQGHVQALALDLLAVVAAALGRDDKARECLAKLGVVVSGYPGGRDAARARVAKALATSDPGAITPEQIESLAQKFHEHCQIALGLYPASPIERHRVRDLLAKSWNQWRSRS